MSSRLAEWYDKFFDMDDQADEAYQQMNDVVVCARLPYFQDVLGWLENEAHAQLAIGDPTTMTAAIVRTNTFKEIHDRLTAEIRKAERAIALHKETRNG